MRVKSNRASLYVTRRRFLSLTSRTAGALLLSPALAGVLPLTRASAGAKAGNVTNKALRLSAIPGAAYGVEREVWTYDGQVPGALIRATEGDTLRIAVKNNLPHPTTIHWHGIHQIDTWQMDGVEGLTQPGIPTGDEFTYEFLARPAGTHWYHSHTGVQYSEGLFGPIIIDRRDEPGPYDRDEVLVVNDWFRKPSDEILEELREGAGHGMGSMPGMPRERMPGMKPEGMPGHQMAEMPEMADIADFPFDFGLINGRGRRPGDTKSPLTTFEARQGERIRLRIINASSTYAFRLQIDGHPLTLIATDGTPVRSVTVDNLLIPIGERYDVLVDAKETGAFWMRAVTLDGNEVRAVLRTHGPGRAEPAEGPVAWGPRALTLDMLRPEQPVSLAGKPFREVVLRMGGDMVKYGWTINGQPYLNADPIPLERGESIRLVLENPTTMDHPMHLHGHSFYVLGPPDKLNLTTPVLKDTVNLPAQSTLVLQWEATNPGKWLFHCHIEWHLATGMASVFVYRSFA